MKIRDLLWFADIGKIHARGTADSSKKDKLWSWLSSYVILTAITVLTKYIFY